MVKIQNTAKYWCPDVSYSRIFSYSGYFYVFHPLFSDFLRDINDLNLPIHPDICQLAMGFIYKSANFYTTKYWRLGANKEPLTKVSGPFLALKFGKGDTACGGNLITNVDNQVAYRMVLEVKNSIRDGGCDPTIQMSIYYRGYWSQDDSQRVRDISCCPTFGIATAGPWMCVLGAIFLGKVVVEPLRPFIFLSAALADSLGNTTRVLSACNAHSHR